MPIIKSARKRVKIAAKAKSRNLHTKRQLREAIKAYSAALESAKPVEIAKTQAAAMSALDTAAKKAVIHKNKATRFKSKLAQQAKVKGVKPSKSTKATAKKASPKKVAVKKATATKKTAAKPKAKKA